jgi:hypothetical protein
VPSAYAGDVSDDFSCSEKSYTPSESDISSTSHDHESSKEDTEEEWLRHRAQEACAMYHQFCGGTSNLRKFLANLYESIETIHRRPSWDAISKAGEVMNQLEVGRQALELCREVAFDTVEAWEESEGNLRVETIEESLSRFRECFLAYHLARHHLQYLLLTFTPDFRWVNEYRDLFRYALGIGDISDIFRADLAGLA